MKYANIKYYDISNGLGVRTSLFVSGCTHKCKGCFNEEAQAAGDLLDYCAKKYCVTVSRPAAFHITSSGLPSFWICRSR